MMQPRKTYGGRGYSKPRNQQPKSCVMCVKNLKAIDFKEVSFLRKFITPQAKIASRRRTGTCARHQRQIAQAVKRARVFGLIPFTTRVIDTR